ncbi:MAG: nucleoside triphosphate pyrophosphohydrolase [Clostridia bacterium]|nr:nucleoside triphosphate pyrophosphohydrolase [Clostridia bacterium]MBQ4157582.1 nucleoside triphosphate pyrophosphohydrolase [Clostridia bacterium]
MKSYSKIVRDKIPEIIEKSGKSCVWEKVSTEEAVLGLENKLLEEVREYLESREIEELADVLEVIHGICCLRNVNMEEVEKIRLEKKEKRGGFEEGIRLLEVYEAQEAR